MSQKLRDVEAALTFLPTEHGGRSGEVFSSPQGYRAQFYYGNHDWDAAYEFPDVAEAQPVPLGRQVRVFIAFLSPDEHDGRIDVGTPFLAREGNRVVGFGSITRIIDLPSSAARLRDLHLQAPERTA